MSTNPIAVLEQARNLALQGVSETQAIQALKDEAKLTGCEIADNAAQMLYQQTAVEMQRWQPRTLADARSAATEEPPWVIKGLVLEQSATLVSAQPHSIKSLSWLAAGMQAVAQRKVWGHFEAPSVERTLFIETEDPLWLVESRIRGLAEGVGLNNSELSGFSYLRPGPFDLVKEEETLRTLIRHHKPNLVILSTLQNMLGARNYIQQVDMAPVAAAVLRLAQVSPIVLLTHSPWNNSQRRAAGTVTLSANFATTIHYRKSVQGGSTFAHLRVDSKVGSAESDFRLKVESDGNNYDPASVRSIIYDGNGWPQGAKEQAILGIAEDRPEATAPEIAQEIGCSPRYVRKVLKKARDEEAD